MFYSLPNQCSGSFRLRIDKPRGADIVSLDMMIQNDFWTDGVFNDLPYEQAKEKILAETSEMLKTFL